MYGYNYTGALIFRNGFVSLKNQGMTEPTEKWQDLGGRLGRLRVNVLLGVVLTVFFILLITWLSAGSVRQILHSVSKLSTPRTEGRLLNEMVSGISAIQVYSGKYSSTGDTVYLRDYHSRTENIRLLIDSMQHASGARTYIDKIDTLESYFNGYVESLDEYIAIRSRNQDPSENKLYGLLASSRNNLETNKPLPRTEIIRTTETVPVYIKEEKTVKPKNRRQRKDTPAETVKVDTLKPTVTTQVITKVDSSYFQQMDTLVKSMKKTLDAGVAKRTVLQNKIADKEQTLLDNEMRFMDRIQLLLSEIDKQEQLSALAETQAARDAVDNSTRKLVILGSGTVFIMLILLFTVSSDVSKSLFYRKKLIEAKQEAERLAIAKEEFLANMSHEIRTPLNSIIGFAEQLNQSGLQPGQKAKVHAVLRSGDHLLALVNDILDYSKIEAGSLRLEKIGFYVTDVVDEVIEVLEPEAEAKGLHIYFEPGEWAELQVSGDPVRLKQILLNLAGNAVKFTHSGHLQIKIDARVGDEEVRTRFTVADTGDGIPAEKLNSIFAKFEQADTSVTRKFGGSGLGLSICKKLVELQNGTIYAQSQPGSGSEFIFEIPYGKASNIEYKSERKYNEEALLQVLENRQVLVVDDDAMTEALLQPFFAEEKAIVSFEKNPLSALEKLRTNCYDLIIADLHMPGMDGISFLEKARSLENNRTARTILCTASVARDIKSKHIDEILHKPYRRNDLQNSIGKVFDVPVNETFTDMAQFSLDYFLTFAGGDTEQLERFVGLFIENSRKEILKIKQAFHEGNTEQIGESAHLLKNTYGQLKATEAMEIIRRLEGLVEEKYLSNEEIERLIEQLDMRSEELFGELVHAMQGIHS